MTRYEAECLIQECAALRPDGTGWVALKDLEHIEPGTSCSHMTLQHLLEHLERGGELGQVKAIVYVPAREHHHHGP